MSILGFEGNGSDGAAQPFGEPRSGPPSRHTYESGRVRDEVSRSASAFAEAEGQRRVDDVAKLLDDVSQGRRRPRSKHEGAGNGGRFGGQRNGLGSVFDEKVV